MNIFSNLANTLKGTSEDTEVELTEGEAEAQAKAERIKFHREKVRNGPTSFKMLTSGQIRRAIKRDRDSQTRKAWRGEVRSYFERQRVASYLRPHLQTVGILPFVDGHEAPISDQITSTAWIAQRYGVEVTDDGKKTGHVSFLREDILKALETACTFYRSATGDERAYVSSDFVPAIFVDVDSLEGAH